MFWQAIIDVIESSVLAGLFLQEVFQCLVLKIKEMHSLLVYCFLKDMNGFLIFV